MHNVLHLVTSAHCESVSSAARDLVVKVGTSSCWIRIERQHSIFCVLKCTRLFVLLKVILTVMKQLKQLQRKPLMELEPMISMILV